jgi:Golgi apparatus protein 1
MHAQDCLRDKAVSVSWECQEELFRQEVENAEDMRLSQRLFKKCMGDKKKFCPDVKFGARHAAALTLCRPRVLASVFGSMLSPALISPDIQW